MSSSAKIIELRELLASKHPARVCKPLGSLPTGLTQVDAALHGGLALGGMTEAVCSTGGGLLLTALLQATLERKGLLALIDGADAFDPAGVPRAALARLLWVRGKSAAQAVQAADLLLRDGNLSLVVMDLRSNRAPEIGRVPATSWYRLQRVVEPTSTAFLILTRQPLVSAARPRVLLEARCELEIFDRRQRDLMVGLCAARVRGNEERERQYA